MTYGGLSGIAKLLGAAGMGAAAPSASAPSQAVSPAGAPAAADGEPATVLESDAVGAIAAAKQAGIEEGRKAERDRTSAVMASPAARANVGAAAFMLAKSDASAEDIIADLPNLGPAAVVAPAPAAAAPAPQPALSVDLEETPKVELGAPAANANDGGDNGIDTDKMWAEVQAKRASSETPLVEGGRRVRGKNN